MKIKVEMTVDEYDDYRAYQKGKAFADAETNKIVVELRRRLNKISDNILNAIKETGNTAVGKNCETTPEYEIRDHSQMADAMSEIQDWFS